MIKKRQKRAVLKMLQTDFKIINEIRLEVFNALDKELTKGFDDFSKYFVIDIIPALIAEYSIGELIVVLL